MAVGTDKFPVMQPVKGFRLGIGEAGIKAPQQKDLVIMAFAESAAVAACFTQNAFCAAPVQVAKEHMATANCRYLVVNTGNANAGTGEQGLADAMAVCKTLAGLGQCQPQQILPYSTGVIGEALPVDKILAALPATLQSCRENGWHDAALAILTTDTRPKGASRQCQINGETITITGISKGAGMIKPNMATMLAYVATDASIAADLLQKMLTAAVEKSFNRITVDGDTSTNDAVTLVATGQSATIISESAHLNDFQQALDLTLIELAQAIVRDGEGATKFISVRVSGGRNSRECLQVAYSVAESPLVKTALFAADPNWGRILAAIGKSGVKALDVNQISVHLDKLLIAENGGRAASYTEAEGQQVMNQDEIVIAINLARGEAEETVWTTDLSYDYIKINAEYRT